MLKDRFKPQRSNPLLAWIAIGVLLLVLIGLLAAYALRPGRTPTQDARTATVVGDMDTAQGKADERREAKRRAAALLN